MEDRLLDATGVLSVTLDAVSVPVRETVEKVQELVQGRAFGDKAKEAIGDLKYRGGISVSQLAHELGLSVSATSRRVKQATKGGYLVNGEDKKGYPAKLLTGEPLPAEHPLQ